MFDPPTNGVMEFVPPGARPLSAPDGQRARPGKPRRRGGPLAPAAFDVRLVSCRGARPLGRLAPLLPNEKTAGASEQPGEGEPQVAQPARADFLGCVTIGSPCSMK